MLSCLSLASLWSPAGKRVDILAVECVAFLVICHFPKCALVHIRIKGVIGAVKHVSALQCFLLSVPRQCFLILWILFVINVSRLSLLYCLVCSSPAGKGLAFWLSCV